MPEAENPEDLNARLRVLARRKPTRESRAEVEAMLDHKWEGVQTVAARVLGEWGGPESVVALRAWLERLQERPYGWAARDVAAKALAMCVTEADLPWVFDFYFELPSKIQYEVLPVLTALPRRTLTPLLEAEATSADPRRREAAERALRRIAASGGPPDRASHR